MKNNNNNNNGGANIQSSRPNNQTGPSDSNEQPQHYHDKRKPYQNQNHQQQYQQQHYKNQSRERSGQRGQFPDSSMGGGRGDRGDRGERGGGDFYNRQSSGGYQQNLGAVKFATGEPTRELPTVTTRTEPGKKFSGRCRLFVANLAHNTTEEKLKNLFERFGEIGEIFISPKQNTYAFIKMDSKANAEAARDALDCTTMDGRILRVRLASHPAAIRVKHLSSEVTDELLAYSFRFFGEIERAVVILNKKGKSTGEGIVEFVNRQSAAYAVKKCETESFMLTSSLQPVLVEKFDPLDEDEGYPESGVNKNSIEFKEQREVGPRFAIPGTFEHNFGMRWKELYAVEQAKREQLENEIQAARKELLDQIKYSKIEHDTIALRNQLQQLEDTRLKLQQFKEQTVNTGQHQEEYRRQQDMMLRQREDDILRRQQMGANLQQAMPTRVQNVSGSRDQSNDNQADRGSTQPNDGPDMDAGLSPPIHFAPPVNQPVTFGEGGLMNLPQPPFIQMHPQMVIPPPTQNHPAMFAPFMQQQQMQMAASTANTGFVPQPVAFTMAPQHMQQNNNLQQSQQSSSGGQYRPQQQKFRRDYPNQGGNNNNNSSNNSADNRGRKRNKQY